ncbi:hypothetical protein Salat_2928300 [Sesamum alatum]|uniref:Uncharacterized protein n=1 Tax=Sesamum alatum TaxID=300844 RepID=A0AAE1XJ60_9LAMI|nr:hypothetical protein Salat_2928300 [Sesamum alatum]
MKIEFWNMRGFNRPSKHNGVTHLIKNNQLCLLGILETKLAASVIPRILTIIPGMYELKDFVDCCLAIGLYDAPTTDFYYTWYSNNDSNPVWCKLDRVLLNNEWLEAELHCGAHFSPSGCLSDYSLGIVSILDLPAPKPKPFRFFNIWANHPDFLATVEDGWNLNVEGTPQFSLCRKLKALKGVIKTFNNLHYNHISGRAKEVDLVLQDARSNLNPTLGM